MILPFLELTAEIEMPAEYVGSGRATAPEADDISCAIAETPLVYTDRPGAARCVTEDDPEFQKNYVDNNIDQAIAEMIPDTTWENIDHDHVVRIRLIYKDGRTLLLDPNDIPMPATVQIRRPKASSIIRPLTRYEKRSDGFIYPIRGTMTGRYVSYADASNLVSLRAGLHEQIEELKRLFTLVELGATFAQNIAALGGMVATNKAFDHGGLFTWTPRSSRTAGSDGDATTGRTTAPRTSQTDPDAGTTPARPRPGSTPARGQKLLDFKPPRITSDDDPRSVKRARQMKTPLKSVYEVKKASTDPDTQAEVRMGEKMADDGHEVHFSANEPSGDLRLDGVATDVKHLHRPDGVSSAIQRSRRQSPQVIIDGTTVKLTAEQAEAGLRAFEAELAQRPAKFQSMRKIIIVYGDGTIHYYHLTGAPLRVERVGAGGTGLPR